MLLPFQLINWSFHHDTLQIGDFMHESNENHSLYEINGDLIHASSTVISLVLTVEQFLNTYDLTGTNKTKLDFFRFSKKGNNNNKTKNNKKRIFKNIFFLYLPIILERFKEFNFSFLNDIDYICWITFLENTLTFIEFLLLREINCDPRQFMHFQILMHDRMKKLYFFLKLNVLECFNYLLITLLSHYR